MNQQVSHGSSYGISPSDALGVRSCLLRDAEGDLLAIAKFLVRFCPKLDTT